MPMNKLTQMYLVSFLIWAYFKALMHWWVIWNILLVANIPNLNNAGSYVKNIFKITSSSDVKGLYDPVCMKYH